MGISGWQLLIVAVIVVLIFGTKKLRNVGQDLGGAIKNFRKAIKDEDKATEDNTAQVIDTKAQETSNVKD